MTETVYLKGDGFLVTNARVVAGDRTFALTHVTGIGGYDLPASKVCAELVSRDRLCPGSADIPTKAQMERWHPACHDYCVDGVQQRNSIEPEERIPSLESGTWTISVSNTVNSARQTGGQLLKDSEQVTVPYDE